jgi:hypothetical protein
LASIKFFSFACNEKDYSATSYQNLWNFLSA